MVAPLTDSWAGVLANTLNMDRTTIGQGTSFPATWDILRLFFRTDTQNVYQNTGTFGTPVFTLINVPTALVFTTKVDNQTSDATTTSDSYVTTQISITMANRSGGIAMIAAGLIGNNASLGQRVVFGLHDDGSLVTGRDVRETSDPVNIVHCAALTHAMSLDGSAITVRFKRQGGTAKILGSTDGHSHLSIAEIGGE